MIYLYILNRKTSLPVYRYSSWTQSNYESYKMIRYAVVLENGLLYELVGRLGVKKQKKKWKTC